MHKLAIALLVSAALPYWDSQNNTIVKVPGVTIKKS